MHAAFEAVWEQGQIIPVETIYLQNHTRLLVVALDEQPVEHLSTAGWQTLKGAYQGKLSTVDEFIQRKQEEKRLER